MKVLIWVCVWGTDNTQQTGINTMEKIKQGEGHMNKGLREGRARAPVGAWGRGSRQKE